MSLVGFAGNGDGTQTAAAGTVINFLIQPKQGAYAHLKNLQYLDAGTQHTITTLRSLSVGGGPGTTTSGTAAGGQPNIIIVTNPGSALPTPDPITNNDWVCFTETDGITRPYQVSSVTSGTQITLTSNLLVGTAPGAPFWFLGIPGDIDQRTGKPHPSFKSNSNSTPFPLKESDGFDVGTISAYEPILVQSNNITNAGTIQAISWMYTLR